MATALVLHQPSATETGLSVRYGPEGYPSPPSSGRTGATSRFRVSVYVTTEVPSSQNRWDTQ